MSGLFVIVRYCFSFKKEDLEKKKNEDMPLNYTNSNGFGAATLRILEGNLTYTFQYARSTDLVRVRLGPPRLLSCWDGVVHDQASQRLSLRLQPEQHFHFHNIREGSILYKYVRRL